MPQYLKTRQQGRRMPERFQTWAALLTPLIAGCAQIKFSVVPTTICPGETVQIDWFSDKVTLMLRPAAREREKVLRRGQIVLSYEMHDSRSGSGIAQECPAGWDITVIPTQSSRLLGGSCTVRGSSCICDGIFDRQRILASAGDLRGKQLPSAA
jgi:hypothetical protein